MIECIMRRIECPMMNFRNIDDLLFVNVGCIDHVVYVHLVKQGPRVERAINKGGGFSRDREGHLR